MDRIDEIIDSAISLTDMVLANTPEHAVVAVKSLRRLQELLSAGLPDHAALIELDRYLTEIEQKRNLRKLC